MKAVSYEGVRKVAVSNHPKPKLKSPTDASNLLLSGKRIFKAHLTRLIQEYASQDAAIAAEVFQAALVKRALS